MICSIVCRTWGTTVALNAIWAFAARERRWEKPFSLPILLSSFWEREFKLDGVRLDLPAGWKTGGGSKPAKEEISLD